MSGKGAITVLLTWSLLFTGPICQVLMACPVMPAASQEEVSCCAAKTGASQQAPVPASECAHCQLTKDRSIAINAAFSFALDAVDLPPVPGLIIPPSSLAHPTTERPTCPHVGSRFLLAMHCQFQL
jgi:hypothetical protein